MAEDRQVEVVQGYSMTGCSSLKDQDAAEKSSTVTVTMGTGVLDEEAWNWVVWNNRKAVSSSIELPRLDNGIVTAGSVAIPSLTVDQPNVSVVILGSESPGNIPLDFQASGTGVTPATFEVNAGSVAVDPIYNGRTAVVYYRTLETNIEITGGNTTYSPYERIEIFAKICGTRFAPKRIWCPFCTSITGFNLDPSSDSFDREFRAFLPEGWSQVYAEFTAL